jgi:hypothetical protein
MPLPELDVMIRGRVPFLSDSQSDLDKIASKLLEAFYFLQAGLSKTDEEVEDESTYNPLEKLLIADLVAYWLITENMKEKSIGTGATGGKTLKKVKAADVEAEFMFPEKGSNVSFSSDSLLSSLKESICQKAVFLKVYVPICGDCDGGAVPTPFIYISDYDTPPKSLW